MQKTTQTERRKCASVTAQFLIQKNEKNGIFLSKKQMSTGSSFQDYKDCASTDADSTDKETTRKTFHP